jgi:cell wall-associated NlpC family hydrolase
LSAGLRAETARVQAAIDRMPGASSAGGCGRSAPAPGVGRGNLAPGDVAFFAHDTGDPGAIHHVGMYIGGGAMIEAPVPGPGPGRIHRPP